MKASEVLRASLTSFDGGKNWRGFASIGAWGVCGNCAQTAIDRLNGASESSREFAENYFLKAIDMAGADYCLIWDWNDAPERTFADVEAAFQKAIELAEAEGN